ncbi:21455_t:CDS:2 [Cetraspora pellucida]|uniref:21455_t:CDS:1 n=1 Tax=Cetraspora pellucida TaxID=1433469 RepID=A0A9N9IQU8_9GLOM|nr:21455_t:CDS:2 [Cetraspora pellucida]
MEIKKHTLNYNIKGYDEKKLQIEDLIDLTNSIIIEDYKADNLENNNNYMEGCRNLHFCIDDIVKEALETTEQ